MGCCFPCRTTHICVWEGVVEVLALDASTELEANLADYGRSNDTRLGLEAKEVMKQSEVEGNASQK